MKKIIFLTILSLAICSVTFAYAKTKQIEFREVVKEETKNNKAKTYSYSAKPSGDKTDLLVAPETVLSNKDIDQIIIIRKEQNRLKNLPILDIIFTSEASKKFADFTQAHVGEELAVLIDNQLFLAPYLVHPVTKGHYLLSTWKIPTNEEAEQFAKDLGFTPTFKTLKEQ